MRTKMSLLVAVVLLAAPSRVGAGSGEWHPELPQGVTQMLPRGIPVMQATSAAGSITSDSMHIEFQIEESNEDGIHRQLIRYRVMPRRVDRDGNATLMWRPEHLRWVYENTFGQRIERRFALVESRQRRFLWVKKRWRWRELRRGAQFHEDDAVIERILYWQKRQD